MGGNCAAARRTLISIAYLTKTVNQLRLKYGKMAKIRGSKNKFRRVTRGVVGGEGEAGKTTVLCGGVRAFVVGFALKNGKK